MTAGFFDVACTLGYVVLCLRHWGGLRILLDAALLVSREVLPAPYLSQYGILDTPWADGKEVPKKKKKNLDLGPRA